MVDLNVTIYWALVVRDATVLLLRETLVGSCTVANPAIVLDIDETSLSNWPEIPADEFGYIGDGPAAATTCVAALA
jgi:hypothetical protein